MDSEVLQLNSVEKVRIKAFDTGVLVGAIVVIISFTPNGNRAIVDDVTSKDEVVEAYLYAQAKEFAKSRNCVEMLLAIPEQA
jgi:hypothetical protein